MTAWYEKSFGREYLELYTHRDADEARADIQAIVQLLSPPKDEPLLDLCCGACRHLLVLREMGFSQLVGLDLSEELLQVAAECLADGDTESGEIADCVRLVRADMRAIPYENYFATVLSLFTSFGYFERDEENQAVLEAVHRSLKPGGRFLMDYVNRDHVMAHLVEKDENVLPDRYVENVRCLTNDCRRVEKTTTVTTESGAKRTFRESVRLYSEAEMVELLRAAGLVPLRSYGSLKGRDFGPESKRLVIVAEKKERK